MDSTRPTRSRDIQHNDVLLVTGGFLSGKIVYSDDDGWEYEDRLKDVISEGTEFCPTIRWQIDEIEDDETGEIKDLRGCLVSYCYTQTPFYKRPTYTIPHAWLKVPSLGEMFDRLRACHEEIADLDPNDDHFEAIEYGERLYELDLIREEIRFRERLSELPTMMAAKVFLCHASEDKGFVRRVYQDLLSNQQLPWLDEAEITAGQSIVDAVDRALDNVDAFVLFLSHESIRKAWVKKEWNAALMRRLSDADLLFVPALIDDVKSPAIISDLLQVRFFEDYGGEFEKLHRAIQTHMVKKS